MTEFAAFDFEKMSPADCYRLTVSTVVPRPIGWVVTKGRNGVVNAAPYSFFNAMGENPVILCLGLLRNHQGGGYKHTAGNIRDTGEFVVNLVPFALAEKMNVTTADVPADVSEVMLAGLTAVPSDKVAPPRIAESPVGFECTVMHALETGPDQLLVVGRVVQMHIAQAFLAGKPERPTVLTAEMGLIGRMHGRGMYARTTDLFEMNRPKSVES